MTKDLGTYHVIVETSEGGFILEWNTGGRFIGGGTDLAFPMTATWLDPIYENEDELIESIIFMFDEGNYSCDCNMRMFLDRANQVEEKDNPDCGDTILLQKLTLVRPDGSKTVIFTDELNQMKGNHDEPQLSAEMEKQFDELKVTYLNDMGIWKGLLSGQLHPKAITELKHFLATALEEQRIQAEIITTEIVARVVADERAKVLSEVERVILENTTVYQQRSVITDFRVRMGEKKSIKKYAEEKMFYEIGSAMSNKHSVDWHRVLTSDYDRGEEGRLTIQVLDKTVKHLLAKLNQLKEEVT